MQNRRFALAAVVDLFFPWAGTALTRKPPAGRWGMIFWMVFQISLVLWVLTNVLELPQALAIEVVAWVVAQILVQSKSLEAWRAAKFRATAEPPGKLERYLSIALVLAVYVVTPTVFATRMAGNLDTVKVSDLGMFPTVLQDETILVLKSRSGIDAGRLVVFDAPGGPQIGRVVAVGGEHVEVSEGLVSIDRQPSTVSRREAIDFPDIKLNARESLESAGLQYFLEKHLSAEYETPAFLRPGVYTVGSGVDVPEGSVYVLSDNRTSAEAVDSRHTGPVAIKDISGVPLFVVWSGGGGVLDRLERIGAWTR